MKCAVYLMWVLLLLHDDKIQPDQPSLPRWESRGIGGGGALYAPSFSPYDNDEVYITSDMGDLFHSFDVGASWKNVRFSEIVATTSSQVRFTDDPNILYSIRTNGWQAFPVKSMDRGTTWSDLPGDPTGGETYYLFADPDNGQRVLLSSYSQLYLSTNGGSSFNQVYSASDLYIGGVFWDGINIFVGCRTGLLVSEDSGATFSLEAASGDLPGGHGMLSLTGAKEGGVIRLFCVARDSGDMWPAMQGSEFWGDQAIFRLDWNDPAGWQTASTGIDPDDFPFFVSMARNEIDVVYTAGATHSPVYPMVCKSADGGASWQNTFLVQGNQNIATGWQCDGGDMNWWWGGCALGFAVCPNNPDRALITDFGFAHATTDGGTSWRQVYVSPEDENPPGDVNNKRQYYHGVGLEPTSCWWITWIDKDNLFVSFTDITGIRSRDGGESWSFDYSGNDYNTTYHTVRDPVSGTLYGATSSVHDIYQSSYLRDNKIDAGSGEVLFSTDQGESWQTLHDFDHPVIWLALDPQNSNCMYASVVHSVHGDLYVTKDLQNGSSSTWSRLTSPPRTEGHPYNIRILDDGTLVCTYSARIDGSGAFTLSSGVYVSADGGATWDDRTDSRMQRWTKDVIIDPHDPDQNTWYAGVFSHWGAYPNEVGGVYRTEDRGLSWTELGDFYRVESCSVHPADPNRMYVTTEGEGLWLTEDLKASDPDFSLVAEYPFMHPVRVLYNPFKPGEIWATSFGNGLRVRAWQTYRPVK
jgi:photosystem II stability/assembly factor-like uncharacterized protein